MKRTAVVAPMKMIDVVGIYIEFIRRTDDREE